MFEDMPNVGLIKAEREKMREYLNAKYSKPAWTYTDVCVDMCIELKSVLECYQCMHEILVELVRITTIQNQKKEENNGRRKKSSPSSRKQPE